MSDKKAREFTEKLNRDLEIAEKRRFEEKTLRGEDLIVCSEDGITWRIPTKQVIADNPPFQQHAKRLMEAFRKHQTFSKNRRHFLTKNSMSFGKKAAL